MSCPIELSLLFSVFLDFSLKQFKEHQESGAGEEEKKI